MKYRLYSILGFLLLLTAKAPVAAALSINDFRKTVFKPINLPGIRSQVMGPEAKLNVFLSFFIDLILYASGALAVLMLVVGSIRYIISLGEQDAMEKAKKTINWALIGLMAVILAFFVVTNVTRLLYESAL